jgi:zinc protease
MSTKLKIAPIKINKFTLENGLRVVLNEDNSAPVVSVAVYYDVGSRNERKGRDGFAHLFEHMMFQGSENIPKAGHFTHISRAGGTMNGTTASQRTNYYETLPASQLPLALWLESDRMLSLNISQENLENQRAVVIEEKRQRYDNQPYGQVFDLLTEMVFVNFANSHSTIGSVEDLNAATLEDVVDFFRVYYAPNNAVLTVSGSFETDSAIELIEKYFATIPRQPNPAEIDVTEPEQIAVKHKIWEDKLAPLPAFLIGWKIPVRRTKDFYALYLAGKLLYDGESSRLYQKLVKGEESVLQLFGFTDERRGPSMATIGAIPKPEQDVKQIRQAIFDEIESISKIGVSEEEMNKLRNQLTNDEIRSRQSSLGRARQLAEYTLYDNEPELANTEIENYLEITADDIKFAVNKYLNTENRAELDVIPAGKK